MQSCRATAPARAALAAAVTGTQPAHGPAAAQSKSLSLRDGLHLAGCLPLAAAAVACHTCSMAVGAALGAAWGVLHAGAAWLRPHAANRCWVERGATPAPLAQPQPAPPKPAFAEPAKRPTRTADPTRMGALNAAELSLALHLTHRAHLELADGPGGHPAAPGQLDITRNDAALSWVSGRPLVAGVVPQTAERQEASKAPVASPLRRPITPPQEPWTPLQGAKLSPATDEAPGAPPPTGGALQADAVNEVFSDDSASSDWDLPALHRHSDKAALRLLEDALVDPPGLLSSAVRASDATTFKVHDFGKLSQEVDATLTYHLRKFLRGHNAANPALAAQDLVYACDDRMLPEQEAIERWTGAEEGVASCMRRTTSLRQKLGYGSVHAATYAFAENGRAALVTALAQQTQADSAWMRAVLAFADVGCLEELRRTFNKSANVHLLAGKARLLLPPLPTPPGYFFVAPADAGYLDVQLGCVYAGANDFAATDAHLPAAQVCGPTFFGVRFSVPKPQTDLPWRHGPELTDVWLVTNAEVQNQEALTRLVPGQRRPLPRRNLNAGEGVWF